MSDSSDRPPPPPGADQPSATDRLRARLERARSSARAQRSSADAAARTVPRRAAGPAPISRTEQRLWFFYQLNPDDASYHVRELLDLSGPLDRARLRAALAHIVARHDALRTAFLPIPAEGPPTDDPALAALIRAAGAMQTVLPAMPLPFLEVDLRGVTANLDAARIKRVLDRLVHRVSLRPFQLERPPLLRFVLFRMDDDRHRLLLAIHHIVFDGWSADCFRQELKALYGALGDNPRSGAQALPPLPIQTADYALWHRQTLTDDGLAARVASVKDRLSGAPEIIDLPFDRPRQAVDRPAVRPSGHLRLTMPEDFADALRALTESLGATTFMIGLATWAAYLSRITGQDEVVIGSPVAGRDRRELEPLIGFFVNNLVLRLGVAADDDFRTAITHTRDVVLTAQADQDIPFPALVEALAPRRDLHHTPIFQVLFGHLIEAQHVFQIAPELEALSADTDAGLARFELSLQLREIRQADDRTVVQLMLIYDATLFDRSAARRILTQVARLLDAAVRAPAQPLAAHPLLDAAGRHQVVRSWSSDGRNAPATLQPLPNVLRAQARRDSGAVAIEYRDTRLSYDALERAVDRLALRLRRRGVGPEVTVAVALGRTPELVLAILATWRAGGAFVPIDPELPAVRVNHLLRDSGAWLILSRRDIAPPLPADAPPVIWLDGLDIDDERAAGRSDGTAPPPIQLDQAAYVLYTSGTTGLPKGVTVSHGAIARYMGWLRTGPLAGLRFPLLTKPSFDAFFKQLLRPLLAGETLWIPDYELLDDPDALFSGCAARGQSINTVPSVWQLLVAHLEQLPATKRPWLPAVVLGGEALSPDLARRTFAALPQVRLWNIYGPTEVTVNALWAEIAPHRAPAVPLDAAPAVHLGRPLPGHRAYVVDAGMHPVPPMVAGELALTGDELARGYHRRPALTADRFRPDPFADGGAERVVGGRLYRTGDRVRWRIDGRLDYLGRIDAQIKLRGLRIELGEIDAALDALAAVREAAAALHVTDDGEPQLIGYAVPAADAQPDAATLRPQLKTHLPAALVPTAIVWLDALPRTATGKLDRRALPAPRAAAAAGDAA
ncbi:MAG: amino acid adenylation domain-containing protein, partial [Acidobacteriota bacterium]